MIMRTIIICVFILDAVGYVLRIGEPRQPITPQQAAGEVFGCALLIWGIVANWKVS